MGLTPHARQSRKIVGRYLQVYDYRGKSVTVAFGAWQIYRGICFGVEELCAMLSRPDKAGRESMRTATNLPVPVFALRMLSPPGSLKRTPLPQKAPKARDPAAHFLPPRNLL